MAHLCTAFFLARLLTLSEKWIWALTIEVPIRPTGLLGLPCRSSLRLAPMYFSAFFSWLGDQICSGSTCEAVWDKIPCVASVCCSLVLSDIIATCINLCLCDAYNENQTDHYYAYVVHVHHRMTPAPLLLIWAMMPSCLLEKSLDKKIWQISWWPSLSHLVPMITVLRILKI